MTAVVTGALDVVALDSNACLGARGERRSGPSRALDAVAVVVDGVLWLRNGQPSTKVASETIGHAIFLSDIETASLRSAPLS